MAALHLAASAHTPLKGWYSPNKTIMIRMEDISSVKVNSTTGKWGLVVTFSQEKQEFPFSTLELLNEALAPLHLIFTDLD